MNRPSSIWGLQIENLQCSHSHNRTQQNPKPDLLVGRLGGAAAIDELCCQGPVDPCIAGPPRQGGILAATAWFSGVICSSVGSSIPVRGFLLRSWVAMVQSL